MTGRDSGAGGGGWKAAAKGPKFVNVVFIGAAELPSAAEAKMSSSSDRVGGTAGGRGGAGGGRILDVDNEGKAPGRMAWRRLMLGSGKGGE